MIAYHHLTGPQALEHLDDLKAVYTAVFSEPPYNEGPEMAGRFAGWLRDEVKESGFDLVEARDGEQLVGFAYGTTRLPTAGGGGTQTRPLPTRCAAGSCSWCRSGRYCRTAADAASGDG